MNFEKNPILKIHKFSFLLEKLFDRELHAKFSISFSQFRMLTVIQGQPGVSQKEIAFIQETTQAAVSRLVVVLDRMHLVALATNSANRKEHKLYLTAKGKVVFAKSLSYVERRTETILRIIGTKRSSELYKTLDLLIDGLR